METRIVIVGGGVIGGAIARVLSKYEHFSVHLVEKNVDVGWGATKANTGIIHPGHEDDPQLFPLRAKCCVKGNSLWRKWSEDLDIPIVWPGELMIARDDHERSLLRKYKQIGRQNGVPDLQIIDASEIHQLEPNCTVDAVEALWAPTAGLIEPWEAAIGLIENAVTNGVHLHLHTMVQNITQHHHRVTGVETTNGYIAADVVINAAGVYADIISAMAGIPDVRIQPRKGEYYLFEEDATPKVKRILHHVPTTKTKGVYVVTTVEGNLMLGPTAEDLSPEEKENLGTSQKGLHYVWDQAMQLVRELPPKTSVTKTFAGLRPEPPNGTYIIKAYEEPWGFINVAGIRSPGLTAAPAIAQYVVHTLLQEIFDIPLIEKKKWNGIRRKIQRFSMLSQKQQQEYIMRNPAYGNVVCMCKEVTEAEILEAINRMKQLGDTVTLDSIKFRTLAMFGFCQGSFCRSKVAKILARELKIPLYEVTQRGPGTAYGVGDVKTLQGNSGGNNNDR